MEQWVYLLLAIPLAYSLNPDMSYVIVSTSAVLTGAIFGDHCSQFQIQQYFLQWELAVII